MLKHLEELTALSGISGREDAVRDYIRRVVEASPAKTAVTVDPLGNLLVRVTGEQRAAKTVMFEAHMDEVGMIVTGITDDGYLRFANVGGIDDKVLAGRCVMVNGHAGVLGCKAVHHCDKDERAKPIAADKLLIDIGADTREQAASVVAVGDAVTFMSELTPLSGGRFKAKALDDRAGCALLLSLLEETPPYDITLAFTVQEEVGLRGAAVATYTVQPEISVTVEATTASDIVGTPAGKEVCVVGKGAVLSFMDGRTMYDKALYDEITALAAQRGIAVQPKTVVAGGNDAGAIQVAAHGTRVAAVSLPCRYIHSPSCVLDEADIEAARQLLLALAETLPAEDA